MQGYGRRGLVVVVALACSAIAAGTGASAHGQKHTLRHAQRGCGSAVLASASHARVSEIGCLVNRLREQHHLRPLVANRRLAIAAAGHANDMVFRHYFSHTTPSGRSFVWRIARTGYLSSPHAWCVGEVLAWGMGYGGSPSRVLDAWMASPPHRKVLLDPGYGEMGIAIVHKSPAGYGDGATYVIDVGHIGGRC